ncbi:MAG: monooxygenase [Gaiellales bacterium]
MPTLLQIDFPMEGPWGAEMAGAFTPLAELIGQTAGLRWKIWTESQALGEGGGVYLFADRPSAEAYLEEHTKRLNGFGIANIRSRLFDVNEKLTRLNRGPIDG